MYGHEFIHLHQFPIDPDTKSLFPSVTENTDISLIDRHRPFCDKIFPHAKEAIGHYRHVWPSFTANWMWPIKDKGLRAFNPTGNSLEFFTDTPEDRNSLATMMIFPHAGRQVFFPRQGITYNTIPGSILVFPAYWTHGFILRGRGGVAYNNFVMPE